MSFVKLPKKWFAKHFDDENNFVEDNFSLKLIYHRVNFTARCEQIPFID